MTRRARPGSRSCEPANGSWRRDFLRFLPPQKLSSLIVCTDNIFVLNRLGGQFKHRHVFCTTFSVGRNSGT